MARSGNLFAGDRGAMRYTPAELSHFIAQIREHGPRRGLTLWETGFVNDVARQLEERGQLTDDQINKLDQIYADRTPL